jgi:hypothetical protein
MLIQNAIKLVCSIPHSWVRVEQVRRVSGGLEVCFGIHEGKRGKKADAWIVTCRGVREIKITDLDGGGLAIYSSTHPAAQQYVARRAELLWPCACDEAQVTAALYRTHVETVDDWIPFDRYLLVNTPWNGAAFMPCFALASGSNFVCRGPDFLVRAYAKTLEAIGEQVQVILRGSRRSKSIQPKVLHFGASYVVANTFAAQRPARTPALSRATIARPARRRL